MRAAAVGLAAVLGLAGAGSAQEEQPIQQVVVVQVHNETTTIDYSRDYAAAILGAGFDPEQVLNGLAGGLVPGLGALSSILPRDLVSKIGIGAMKGLISLEKEEPWLNKPRTEVTDYTIYITEDAFRMEMEGFVMLWQAGDVYYTDPATGQWGRAAGDADTHLAAVGSDGPGFFEHTGMNPTPKAGAQTKTLLGHTARGFDYDYDLVMKPVEGSSKQTLVTVEVTGDAWIADDFSESAVISGFFRNYAAAFGDRSSMMGGLTDGMAQLADLGVPLESSQTSELKMVLPGSDGEARPTLMRQGKSTSTVTAISTLPLSEKQFPKDPPAVAASDPGGSSGQPGTCDCSCQAYAELEDLDESDPDAMAKAMCAQKCMPKWMACVNVKGNDR